jgi:hypothetical protein
MISVVYMARLVHISSWRMLCKVVEMMVLHVSLLCGLSSRSCDVFLLDLDGKLAFKVIDKFASLSTVFVLF